MASRIVDLVLLALAPVAIYAGMIAADRHFGHARAPAYVVRLVLPVAGAALGLPPVQGPLDASRPLVVIDAGHGGHDPGAGPADMPEKAVTLALARALRDQLLAEGGIRVALTRDEDRYLLLPERADIARRLKADLFISIHADSADNAEASGATLYTLSDRGSSDTAAQLAAKENRADTVNGIALGGQSDAVSAILVDLSQRESAARSVEFARLVLREAGGALRFREPALQSAAFVVLKSADLPSVLFEAGFISNEADARELTSDAGRAAFADSTARAVRAFFARREPQP
ncbi:N-acetylmuramoyl-L-alanine amidase [Novosphingobium flavum]|uniref:N-acetylmuramoyl-L-alanine amidase family protein n=1 Tax=Novosphingobium flavum TaxID=1778672 RepID=UPI0031B636D1